MRIAALFVILFAGVLLFAHYQAPNNRELPAILLAPTPTPTQPQDVHSEDGTQKVSTTVQKNKDGSLIYSFYVSDILGANKKLLFTTTTSSPNSGIWASPNAWSPNNKYIFLSENQNGLYNALVFKTSGEAFSSGALSLDVVQMFNKNKSDFYITEVTGWDDPLLVHVLTNKDKNTKGPAFWFDISSQSFIQLANR